MPAGVIVYMSMRKSSWFITSENIFLVLSFNLFKKFYCVWSVFIPRSDPLSRQQDGDSQKAQWRLHVATGG